MDTRKSTIKDFLSKEGTFFQIPVYQRNYCWEKEQCRELFDDILASMERGRKHFLGTICYKEEENNTEIIIDGQQRITSLMLLFKALYDVTESEELRNAIQANYLLNADETGLKLKLKPIQRDTTVYKRLISHKRVDSEDFPDSDVSTPLYKAFECFNLWIKELKEIPEYENRLLRAIESLEVIEIIVTDENPQEIFESLNATGMSLTNTDILRNYLLMSIPYKEQVRLYMTYWKPLEELVTTEEIDSFMSSYLVVKRASDDMSINGKTWKINPNTICTCFKNYFKNITIETVSELFADMYKYAQYYNRFIVAKTVTVTTLSNVDTKLHELLGVLKADGFKPLLLQMLDDLTNDVITEEQFLQMIQLLASYVVRRVVTLNKGTVGAQFSGFILIRLRNREVSDSYVKTFKKALGAGQGTYAFPSNLFFEKALLQSSLYSIGTAKLKYILYSIEKYINPNQSLAMTAGTIEHIMPQTLSDAWTRYLAFNGDANIHEEKLNTLGNLTLTESNSTLSNKAFQEKKAIYAESAYAMTQSITDVSVWTGEAIDNRGRYLYSIALKLWGSVETPVQAEENLIRYTFDSEDLEEVMVYPPTSFSFLTETQPVTNWSAIGEGVVTILNEMIPGKLQEIAMSADERLGDLLSTEKNSKKRPYQIPGTSLYLNQAKKPLQQLQQLKDLLQACSNPNHSLCEEFWFTAGLQESADDYITLQ